MRVVYLAEARHDLSALRSSGTVDPTSGTGECMGYYSWSVWLNWFTVFDIFPRVECVYTVGVSTRMCYRYFMQGRLGSKHGRGFDYLGWGSLGSWTPRSVLVT